MQVVALILCSLLYGYFQWGNLSLLEAEVKSVLFNIARYFVIFPDILLLLISHWISLRSNIIVDKNFNPFQGIEAYPVAQNMIHPSKAGNLRNDLYISLGTQM